MNKHKNIMVLIVFIVFLGLIIAGCAGPEQNDTPAEETDPQEADDIPEETDPPEEDTEEVDHTIYEISIGYVPAPESILDKAVNEFARLAEEKSNGQLKVLTFPSSQLGGEAELLDAMQMGTVDMAVVGATIINNVVPEYSLLSGYYLFETQDQFREFLSGSVGVEMHEEILSKKNVRVIGIGDRGVRHMTSNKEVRSIEDLAQLTIRVPEQPIYVDAWREMGANPIAIPGGELFTSLQQGIVDAQENPVDAALTHSFYEVQEYLILTGHQRSVFWWTVAEELYANLPDNLKDILEETVLEATKYQDQLEAEEEATIISQLEELGVVVIEVDVGPFMAAVDPVLQKYAEAGRTDLYDLIISYR